MSEPRWKLRMVCCGRDDGTMYFETWEEADSFRESYIKGQAVDPHGYSGSGPGHQRAAVLSREEPR